MQPCYATIRGSSSIYPPKLIITILAAFVVADLAALGALGWLVGVDVFWFVVGAAVVSLALLLVVVGMSTKLLLRQMG